MLCCVEFIVSLYLCCFYSKVHAPVKDAVSPHLTSHSFFMLLAARQIEKRKKKKERQELSTDWPCLAVVCSMEDYDYEFVHVFMQSDDELKLSHRNF